MIRPYWDLSDEQLVTACLALLFAAGIAVGLAVRPMLRAAMR